MLWALPALFIREFFMDEESLFRDIHSHLMLQAREGQKMDTEMKLAERFNVSRYRVRRVLDILSRMGVVHRAKKRGLTLVSPEPEDLSKSIGSQIQSVGFNAMEFSEARDLMESAVLSLTVKRMTPMQLGRLADTFSQLERVNLAPVAALSIHKSFHSLFLEGCGNRVLQVFAAALLSECAQKLAEAGDNLPGSFVSEIISLDRDLLAALRAGDDEASRAALVELIDAEVAAAAAYGIKAE